MQHHKNLKIDLTTCDKEPIHTIGSIQSHGFLLIFNESSLIIEQVSENAEKFLAIGPQDLLGKALDRVLSAEEYEAIKNHIKENAVADTQLISLKGHLFFAFIHQSGQKIIFECEPYAESTNSSRLTYNQSIIGLQTRLHLEDTLQGLSTILTDFIRSLIAYDRVLVFRFDDDWHAEVLAESRNPAVHSFEGHHFPATDIPEPARALLEKKKIRHIPDVDALAVDITPYLNPSTGAPIDILLSELRNPSPIHLEYLKNMNVYASLSISIMVKGKLWGLVSCGNERPKLINFWERQICEMATNLYANLLLSIQEKKDAQVIGEYKRIEEALIERINTMGSIKKALAEITPGLLDMTQSEGAAIFLDSELIVIGRTPLEKDTMDILEWLSKNNMGRLFYTRSLSKYIENASSYREQASGLLALEISRYNKEYILFFKPEIKEARIWAGNPYKPVSSSPDDLQIHPRKSFEKWVEEIKGKSQPWTLNELEIAQTLIKDITAIRLRNQAQALEQLNRELQAKAEELRLRNDQMEEFARIMTHNLRAPITSINGLYSYYQEEPTADNASFAMEQIHVLSNNLLSTIADLNIILRTKVGQGIKGEAVSIPELIEKELQNLHLSITQSGAEVITELSVTTLIIPKVYLESILHNLISNALKYSSDKRKPSILIKSWLDNDQVHLSVSDNGIGMDLSKVGNKLFGLYRTFHRNKKIDSKGLGLYLTKLQIESLGGEILVESEPDKGTTFTVKLKAT